MRDEQTAGKVRKSPFPALGEIEQLGKYLLFANRRLGFSH